MAWLIPNDYTIEHLPVALAHETNHNVRFQFIKWKNDITLGEMMVSEGLAENFATYLYGEDKAGPWVKKTNTKMLNEYIKPIIYGGLNEVTLSFYPGAKIGVVGRGLKISMLIYMAMKWRLYKTIPPLGCPIVPDMPAAII